MTSTPRLWVKLALTAITIAALAVTLTGCWDRAEIETLGFVTAIGIDEAQEEGKILITLQVARPASISRGSEGGPSQERAFWVVESTGTTIYEALRNLNAVSPRRIYFPHCRLVLFGQEFAQNGVGRAIDWFDRSSEARRLMHVVVAKGTAWEMMQAEFELEPMAAEGLERLTMNAHARLSTALPSTLNDFLQALEREGMDPAGIGAMIAVKKPDPAITGQLKREEVGSSPVISGTAVFKDDRLVGWLEPNETRGFSWLVSKAKGSLIVIEQPDSGSKKTAFASIEVLRSKRTVKVQTNQEKVSFTVTLDIEGNLGEVQGFMDPLKNPGIWTEMERRMAERILQDAESALHKAQELGADIFGFGAEVYRKSPKLWEEIKDRWDSEFPVLDVKIEVKAKLRTLGLTIRPAKIK